MGKYYRYKHFDLVAIERGAYEYYSLEELKENVELIPFDTYEENWEGGTWFVHNVDSISTEPSLYESKDEAYKDFLASENYSLYSYWHDL